MLALFIELLAAGMVICGPLTLRAKGPDSESADKERLLSPESLKGESRAATGQEVRQHFADPPAEYRPALLWSWNDEMAPARLKEQLKQYKDQGIGGTFVHPRSGLITEYLGNEWFDLWRLALDESKRLGLLCNIYDEYSYPSGFAGGQVPSAAPDTSIQFVQAQLVDNPEELAGPSPFLCDVLDLGCSLAVFRLELNAAGRPTRATRISEHDYARARGLHAVFMLRRGNENPFTGYFSYVDLTHPDAGKLFLQSTHELYRKKFGEDFGKTIRWAFTDEPFLASGGLYEGRQMSLPLSFHLIGEFRRRTGYDLISELPSLFWDVGDWRRVRFDYWQTLHDLWIENSLRPVFEWCDRNGLQFTGHFMEHEWPDPRISPDTPSLYPFLHIPGIDMLIGSELRTTGAEPHILMTARQLSSVAHQLGRRALAEAYGVSGWDSTLEHYKRMGDFLIVHGINLLSYHQTMVTVRGSRKRDMPQSFSDVAAWWPYYRLHADHNARLAYVMAMGVAPNRILVLEPTTSGFLWGRGAKEVPELEKLKQSYDPLSQFLADHQVDYDMGDEYLIEWFGQVKGNKLSIGKADYDLVIWPRGMINLRHQTLPVIEEYLRGGGKIVALDEPAGFVDGRPNNAMESLKTRYATQWVSVSDYPGLLTEIRRSVAPRVIFDRELPTGIGHRMVVLEDGGVVHLFTNSGLNRVVATARLEGAGLEEWDTVSGKIEPVITQPVGARQVEFTLDLPAVGSRLYYVLRDTQPATRVKRESPPHSLELGLSTMKITPTTPNVLVLDYCDLKLAGRALNNIPTRKANWEIWQANGFERPAWDNSIQFRQRVLDRGPFQPGSGFEATFRFRVGDAEAITGLQLALETPELYAIYINDQKLDPSAGERWLDPHLTSFPVSKMVKVGTNTVRLVASPFDVRMELENIYLRGNFAVEVEEQGFSLRSPMPLRLGSWAKQGYPFYSDSVLYETQVNVPKGARQLRIAIPDWAGSVLEVLLDGTRVKILGWQPYECRVDVQPGTHTIGVRVVATPRNLFGPFHNPDKPRMVGWPGEWKYAPEHPPPGGAYDLLDYGLMQPIRVEALR